MPVHELTNFYRVIKEDNRITTSHISLYMALFQLWNENDFQNPVLMTRKMVMDAAKISGLATYHKVIKDLHEFGYIEYMPSKNPATMSQVLLKCKQDG